VIGSISRLHLAAALGGIAAVALLALAAGRAAGSAANDRALYTPAELAAILAHSPLGKLPADPTDRVADSAPAATLGQYLFFNTQFSANGKISCASCHEPARAFTDGRKIAKGIALGTRHTPSIINTAFGHWYFWDGRVDSLWSQALQPLENPVEFGGDRLAMLHAVYRDQPLHAAYTKIFGPLPPLADFSRFPAHAGPIGAPGSKLRKDWGSMAPQDRSAADRMFSNLGKAIEAYERRLASGASPFDKYVAGLKAGDAVAQQAMPAAAKRGLELFVGKAHCDLCHEGPLFSDGQFHNIGLPVEKGEVPDPGRAAGITEVKSDIFNGAGHFSDDPHGAAQQLEFLPPPKSALGAFKTPSLRNVALTGPYMHDGRFLTLRQTIEFYAQGKAASEGQLVGTREATLSLVPHLSAGEVADLAAFLKELDSAPPPPALTRPLPQP
jgi:cytochrome c peroxidase